MPEKIISWLLPTLNTYLHVRRPLIDFSTPGVTGQCIFDQGADRDPDFLVWNYKAGSNQFTTWTAIRMFLREGQVRMKTEKRACFMDFQ